MTHASDFPREVEAAVSRHLADWRRYRSGEDADPDAYVDRLRTMLESIRKGSTPDPVAEAALPRVLADIERETESPPGF